MNLKSFDAARRLLDFSRGYKSRNRGKREFRIEHLYYIDAEHARAMKKGRHHLLGKLIQRRGVSSIYNQPAFRKTFPALVQ